MFANLQMMLGSNVTLTFLNCSAYQLLVYNGLVDVTVDTWLSCHHSAGYFVSAIYRSRLLPVMIAVNF